MKEPKKRHKQWLRCARYIQQQYERTEATTSIKTRSDFSQLTERLNQLLRQRAIAQNRGWKAAEEQVSNDYRRQLTRIRNGADSELSSEDSKSSFEMSDTELFRDLLAAQSQFEELEFDTKTKALAGNTKDIVLDGHRFGAFRIVLCLKSLSRSGRANYEVVAIEPNRPSSNDDVTHPHIQCDGLCEGDAQPAIKLALQQGRLFDFFQIVEQVLGTYNASSAYVSLEDWEGSRCDTCGDLASSDGSRECAGCEASDLRWLRLPMQRMPRRVLWRLR